MRVARFKVGRSRSVQSIVFLVVDAIDECSSEVCRESLSWINKLQMNADIRMLVTSRHNIHIEKCFEQDFPGHIQLTIKAHPEDLEIYLNERLMSLSECVRNSSSLRRNVKEQIKAAACGM